MTVHVMNDAPILDQVQEHWAKIAAFLLWKLSKDRPVNITAADIEQFGKDNLTLVTHGHKDSIELMLVTPEAAQRMADHDRQMNRGRA